MSEFDLHLLDEFTGTGDLLVGSVIVPLSILKLIHVRHRLEEPWTIEAFFPQDYEWNWETYRGVAAASLRARVGFNRIVEISQLEAVRVKPGARLRARARELSFDLEDLPPDAELIQLVARLSAAEVIPNRYGVEHFQDDGQISGGLRREHQEILLTIGSGFILEESVYERPESTTGIDIRLRNPVVRVTVDEKRRQAFRQVIGEFRDELDLICDILSFCGRQRVDWFHIEAEITATRDIEHLMKNPELFKSPIVSGTPGIGPLIEKYGIPTDALSQMIDALRKSDVRGAIRLAMAHLIAAPQAPTPEQRIVHSFTALEAIVSGLEEHNKTEYVLSRSKFEKLESAIKQAVTNHLRAASSENDPDMEQRINDICEKIPDLRRRPIVGRVAQLVRTLDIEWWDLWPNGVELEVGLRNAYKVRNSLIHSGKMVDPETTRREWLRIRAIAERVIYRLLGGRAEWLHTLAYRHTDILQKIL